MTFIDGEIKIGEYTIKSKDYANKPWIYTEEGEGMEFNPEDLLKLIDAFYKEKF